MVNMNLLSENILYKTLWFSRGRNMAYCKKINTFHKRSAMLADMFKDRDKKKTWHFEILQNHAKAKNVFENISRPSKRQNVLNVLLIRNITDVLSTGDAAPEILDCGVEVTGVKVSPCCQMVNVYWQLPPSKFSADKDVALILNQNASKIRAELISRNVMGRVPRIYFVRDTTNSYVAAFEKAMKEIDLGDEKDSNVIPDDSFLESIYEFKDAKVERVSKKEEISSESSKVTEDILTESSSVAENISTESSKAIANTNNSVPKKQQNMRTDIFGLDHEQMMSKVLATKTKPKFSQSSNVILTSIGDTNADLFSKIPGTPFFEDVNREELLKKFHIARKKIRNQKIVRAVDNEVLFADSYEEEYEAEPIAFEEDVVEEETPERF